MTTSRSSLPSSQAEQVGGGATPPPHLVCLKCKEAASVSQTGWLFCLACAQDVVEHVTLSAMGEQDIHQWYDTQARDPDFSLWLDFLVGMELEYCGHCGWIVHNYDIGWIDGEALCLGDCYDSVRENAYTLEGDDIPEEER